MQATDKYSSLTAERVRELFDYDKLTGYLTRRMSRGNTKKGSIAGNLRKDGRLQTSINNRQYLNHRLIWLWVMGVWPQYEIDHCNGDPTDNRLENLRDVPTSVNRENLRKPDIDNTSGYLGVSWHKHTKKFQAKIKVSGKQVYLGLFATPEAAHATYLAAKRQFHAGCTI